MSETSAACGDHLVDMSQFKGVRISSVQNGKRQVPDGDTGRRGKSAPIGVQAPGAMHHPHEDVVCQVYPVQIFAMAWASTSAVSGLERLRGDDP